MHCRVLIEFVVDVPNDGVANDVGTRLTQEQHMRVRDVIASVTGYEPLRAPGQPGFFVGIDEVQWNAKEKDWDEVDDDDK
jgi:hypothetical protein